jgi:hypothetical protein
MWGKVRAPRWLKFFETRLVQFRIVHDRVKHQYFVQRRECYGLPWWNIDDITYDPLDKHDHDYAHTEARDRMITAAKQMAYEQHYIDNQVVTSISVWELYNGRTKINVENWKIPKSWGQRKDKQHGENGSN